MEGFDFFRARRPGYAPRTPAAALRAIGAGILPSEHFIYASCSAKPLDEEPFDLEAIERALAREDMEITTAKLLKGILERLVSGHEPETALFGAEGINALEARYLHRIERAKSDLARKDALSGQTGARSGGRGSVLLAQLYREMAELQGRASSIRAFYLREAHRELRAAMGPEHRLSRGIVDLLVSILMDLGLYDQAAHTLEKLTPADDPFIQLLTARVAFQRRDYRRVSECCRALSRHAERLTDAERRAVAFWTGAV